MSRQQSRGLGDRTRHPVFAYPRDARAPGGVAEARAGRKLAIEPCRDTRRIVVGVS